jgi:hypothetical protein
MCGLDSPCFGVEVVGTRTDVLHFAEWMAFEAHLYFARWGVLRKNECLSAKEVNSLCIREFALHAF